MRITLAVAVACLTIGAIAAADNASAAIRKTTNIPVEGLGPALTTLAKEFDFQVLYRTEVVGSLRTQGAVGEFTPDEALKQLLSGTGLTYRYLDDKTVTIMPVGAAATSSNSGGGHDAAQSEEAEKGNQSQGGDQKKKSFWDHFRLAQATPSSSSGLSPQPSALSTKLAQANTVPTGAEVEQQQVQPKLEEIIVTAQKRSEKLMDVPSSIGVISGNQLELLQSQSLTDLAGYVPGLTVSGGGTPGSNVFVIRGISPGAGGATVATYIDDVPIGSSIANTTRGNVYNLDLMPYDIDRLEVLRGPQGTVYGADAVGGLIKYALKKPNLTAFEAQAGGDIADVDSSGGVTWSTRAFANAPIITDTLGVRASGFYQYNAGYVDNVGTGTPHANHGTQIGGRATALWKANDDLSVQATVLSQNIDTADISGVTVDPVTQKPIYGPLAVNTVFPQPFKQQLRDYSLNVDWDVHFATLTNTASWSRLKSDVQADLTSSFGGFVPYPGGGLVKYVLTDTVSKLTEEMRLTSRQDRKIEWMLGGFFTRENGEEDDSVPTYTPAYVPLPPADNFLINTTTSDFKERALFGNAVYKLSEKFDVGGGARYTQNTQTFCTPMSGGIFGAAGPQPCYSRPYVGNPEWMANARFHLNRDSMFYLRWATGYRPGGCNNGCVTTTAQDPLGAIPGTYGVDKLANYEGGFKGEFFDHRLQFDLSVFYIDWRDIQTGSTNSQGIGYTGNGGKATSTGFELTTPYQITDHLLLTPSLGYTNAHLTEDAPGIGGKAGDQLPLSPRWSASLLAEYRQPLGERTQVVVGAGYRYRDTVPLNFVGSGAFVGPLAPQSLVDLYTALVMDHVSARLYAKNVFNNHSYMGGSDNGGGQVILVPVQPRTIGLAIDYRFK